MDAIENDSSMEVSELLTLALDNPEWVNMFVQDAEVSEECDDLKRFKQCVTAQSGEDWEMKSTDALLNVLSELEEAAEEPTRHTLQTLTREHIVESSNVNDLIHTLSKRTSPKKTSKSRDFCIESLCKMMRLFPEGKLNELHSHLLGFDFHTLAKLFHVFVADYDTKKNMLLWRFHIDLDSQSAKQKVCELLLEY